MATVVARMIDIVAQMEGRQLSAFRLFRNWRMTRALPSMRGTPNKNWAAVVDGSAFSGSCDGQALCLIAQSCCNTTPL